MATVNLSPSLSPDYDEQQPGLYCRNHRSVYCKDVQQVIAERQDAEYLAEVIGGACGMGKLKGELFFVSLPIYPELCVWETLSYVGTLHPALGPMGELKAGNYHARHQAVTRILPGESAEDLAVSLRQNFEDDETVNNSIELLRTIRVGAGQPLPLPRCKASSHSMKYQRLLNEMFRLDNVRDNWDAVRDQTYGAMWTFQYYGECVFCWTKRNASDAIRVAPDFTVDSATEGGYADLVPSPIPRRTDERGTPHGASKW